MTAPPPPPLLLLPLPPPPPCFCTEAVFFFFTIVIVKTGKVVHDIQQVYMRTSQAECFENKYLRCYLFVEYTRKHKQQQLACCSLIKHKHRHSVKTACDRLSRISTSLQHAPDPLNLLHTGVRVGETPSCTTHLPTWFNSCILFSACNNNPTLPNMPNMQHARIYIGYT